MTYARYLRIWRELYNIKIEQIAEELGISTTKIRAYERNRDNGIIEKWYIDHGLDLAEYEKVRERYYGKKEENASNEAEKGT